MQVFDRAVAKCACDESVCLITNGEPSGKDVREGCLNEDSRIDRRLRGLLVGLLFRFAWHDGARVKIERFIRENELALKAGDRQVQPDCFFRLGTSGRFFNLAFEIDNSMASIESYAVNSIRQKLTTYQAYQDRVLSQWNAGGKQWERPRLRVVFLTRSVERAYHILTYASESAANKSRRLVYAATYDSFVTNGEPLHAPIFLDHLGNWQSLIDLHPSAPYNKMPVRLTRPVDSLLAVC